MASTAENEQASSAASRTADESGAIGGGAANGSQEQDEEAKEITTKLKPQASESGDHNSNSGVQLEEILTKDLSKALEAKDRGNKWFGHKKYVDAVESYAEALLLVPDEDLENRAIFHSNKAAAHMMLEEYQLAVDECCFALECKPDWTRALGRRAKCYEALDSPTEALEDYKQVLQLDPQDKTARERAPVLEKQVAAKFEKQKDEMIGKLKDLGNGLLGKFGLSLDNFKAVQDPATGSYSINFQR